MFLRNAAAFACITYFLAAAAFLRAARLVFLAAGFFAGAWQREQRLDRLRLHLFGLNRLSGLFLSLCRLLHGLFLHNGLFLDLRLCSSAGALSATGAASTTGSSAFLAGARFVRSFTSEMVHSWSSPAASCQICRMAPSLAPMPTVSMHLPLAQEERRRTVPAGVGSTAHIWEVPPTSSTGAARCRWRCRSSSGRSACRMRGCGCGTRRHPRAQRPTPARACARTCPGGYRRRWWPSPRPE